MCSEHRDTGRDFHQSEPSVSRHFWVLLPTTETEIELTHQPYESGRLTAVFPHKEIEVEISINLNHILVQ